MSVFGHLSASTLASKVFEYPNGGQHQLLSLHERIGAKTAKKKSLQWCGWQVLLIDGRWSKIVWRVLLLDDRSSFSRICWSMIDDRFAILTDRLSMRSKKNNLEIHDRTGPFSHDPWPDHSAGFCSVQNFNQTSNAQEANNHGRSGTRLRWIKLQLLWILWMLFFLSAGPKS